MKILRRIQKIILCFLTTFVMSSSIMGQAYAAPKWHELRILDFPIQVKRLDFSGGKWFGKRFPRGKLSSTSEYCFGSWCAKFTSEKVIARAWPKIMDGPRATGEYVIIFSIEDNLECKNAIEGTRDCHIEFFIHRLDSGLDPDCQINIAGVGVQTFKCPKKIIFE